ncbi:uncharacterized protein LOC9643501 [Selaginella moellendorffii]|uniref:uncharacterized protein LOC9643501 n=1 Tax=Selaginella moellendorffii TaxID=88036 RepID=UPI000D1C794F|nr:uncharacterized protein LOC9643501 [Selaginella moellendorffii]|eukprot:XP_024524342.1 uncharacterized protein LOC9643501 [Selaginella moellendorffii]
MEVLGAVSAAEYTALSRDVDELIEAFAILGCTQLAQMKEVWRCRGFSFIHQARRAKLEPSRFMQILYTSACVHLSPEEPFSWRLGALYAVYILYETQEYSPRVKVYLSLENLQWLLSLAQIVREGPDPVPLHVIRYMVRHKAFLYGHTCVTLKTVKEATERRINRINERLQLARSRLLSSVPTKEHIFGNLASDVGIDETTNSTFQEYEQAKQRIFERVNGQEQQNQADLSNEINNISIAREEFRAEYLRQAQETAMNEDTFEDFNFDLMQFGDDLEEFLSA